MGRTDDVLPVGDGVEDEEIRDNHAHHRDDGERDEDHHYVDLMGSMVRVRLLEKV